MCMKQSSAADGQRCELLGLIKIRNDLEADVITKISRLDWKHKFENEETQDVVLKNCPYDECYFCTEKFEDIMKDTDKPRDLAVLPKCPHLICVRCMLECFKHSKSK